MARAEEWRLRDDLKGIGSHYDPRSLPLALQYVEAMSPLYLAWQARLEDARNVIGMVPGMAGRRDLEWASIAHLKGTLVGFVGPSGAGKDSIREASGIVCALQTTTRPQRAYERDGIHYEFLTHTTFLQARDAGQFLHPVLKEGRGWYGYRPDAIASVLANHRVAATVQSTLDACATLSRAQEMIPGIRTLVVVIVPPEPMFAHLALRHAQRIVQNKEAGGAFLERLVGNLGSRHIKELGDAIDVLAGGGQILFLVNDDVERASRRLRAILGLCALLAPGGK